MKFSVDHASEGIIWMRANGDITYYNDAICTMLGYSPQEFSRLSVTDISGPGYPVSLLPRDGAGWSAPEMCHDR